MATKQLSFLAFPRLSEPVYYWKTVEKSETDPQILWEWQYGFSMAKYRIQALKLFELLELLELSDFSKLT
jgi:hypothetical protein